MEEAARRAAHPLHLRRAGRGVKSGAMERDEGETTLILTAVPEYQR
jgi:hypothetical protein